MIIKTITCHDVYNYGASLQAYALQSHLISLGHDVQIIDYKPEYLNRSYNFWYIPKHSRYYKKCEQNVLFHFLFSLRLSLVTFRTYGRIKPFKKFKEQYLKCTQTVYKNIEDLRMNSPESDIYIAGSDQIWNTNLPNGHDPAFYLDFGESEIKRISYAASFAISKLQDSDKTEIAKYLSRLDAISVREKSGLSILRELRFNGTQVLDPVFLLSEDKWRSLASDVPIVKGNYILVYHLFSDNVEIENMAVKYAKLNNVKIVSINDKLPRAYADINISNAGPIEFVNLILHAHYVIADSFHATAFSTILSRPFSVFYKNSNSSRIEDLLQSIGLYKCYNPQELVLDFNWAQVHSALDFQIDKSIKYLDNELNSIQRRK